MINQFLSCIFPIAVLGLSVLDAATASEEFLPIANSTIVCFGDSITVGNVYGNMMRDLIDARYPERNIRVLGHGVPGDTAAGALKRVAGDVAAVHPDWVLINFGMNDQAHATPEAFITDIEALIARITATTSARVVLVSPICNDRERSGQPTRLDDYAAALKALAERRGLIYVPLTEASNRIKLALPSDLPLSPDGIHPNRIGYWVYTQTILAALGFPLASEPIVEAVPVNLLTEAPAQVRAGSAVPLDLPIPVTINLVPATSFHAKAAHAIKPVVIDGVLKEWDLSQPIPLNHGELLIGQHLVWGKDPALWPTCWLSWDAAGLNLAFRVSDTLISNSDTASIVDRDAIELCLDLRPAAERVSIGAIAFGAHTPHTGQYILSPRVDGMARARCDMGNGPATLLPGVEVASHAIPGGYQLECRIPTAHLPDQGPLAGQILPFDWAVIDVPASGLYNHARTQRWTCSPQGWRHTRDFAELTLMP